MSIKKPIKYAEINDEWEAFVIKFTVFNPSLNDEDAVYITGSKEELGGWDQGTGPIEMKRSL